MIRGILIACATVGITFGSAVGAAQASAQNALQPANVYFGQVVSGDHPTRSILVTNHTGRNQYIRGFILAGSGGNKFSNTWTTATCRVGMNLRNNESCTLTVRVVTTRVEFWQSVQSVVYGPRLLGRAPRGQWNGGVYANVVAS